jgi:hypothetical protein
MLFPYNVRPIEVAVCLLIYAIQQKVQDTDSLTISTYKI